jgi:hypothetical protein
MDVGGSTQAINEAFKKELGDLRSRHQLEESVLGDPIGENILICNDIGSGAITTQNRGMAEVLSFLDDRHLSPVSQEPRTPLSQDVDVGAWRTTLLEDARPGGEVHPLEGALEHLQLGRIQAIKRR